MVKGEIKLTRPRRSSRRMNNPMSSPAIRVFDSVLSAANQEAVLRFLELPSWGFGAYSSDSAAATRYWFKHFSGYEKHSLETGTPLGFDEALDSAAPLVGSMWKSLKGSLMAGHSLTRCYANAYPYGAEGGVHTDSNLATHYTAIYYPHMTWQPDYAGETVFFNKDRSDIIASVYPKPNRLILFSGVIPHSARAVSKTCPQLRITLMFKTAT